MLSKKDIEAYHRDGVVCLKGVLTPEEVDFLRSGVDAQFAECGQTSTGYNFEDFAKQIWTKDLGSDGVESRVDVGAAARFDMDKMRAQIRQFETEDSVRENAEDKKGAAFFYDTAGWKKFDAIRRVAFDSVLPEVSAELMDSKFVNFWEDTTFIKTPGTRQKTVFHQDYAYFQIEGQKCLIAWIPLDPVSTENGTMRYVRGSHLWNRTFAPNLIISHASTDGSTDEPMPNISANEEAYDIISFDAQPGDVLIHHVMTIHGAGGNISNDNRRAISFRYCGDDIRYLDRPGAVPQYGIIDKLNDGDPLLSHDYPVVWPKPWPGFQLAEHWRAPLNGSPCF